MLILKRVLLIFITIGVIGFLTGVGVIFYIMNDLPRIHTLADYKPALPSNIYSRNGELLLTIGKEKREIISIKEIPQRIINSFLAAEDDNFYNHSGVDYIGIIRAALMNIKAGRIVQGASTITQQVAKSLLLSSERTYLRKIKDLLLAKKIEERFTKEEILFLYLNQVYLGGGFYGIKSAFNGYFSKQLSEVTIAESALLAGLLVAPGKYSPYVNPKYAKVRQRYVLKRLFETNKISKQEYEQALTEEIKISRRNGYSFKGGHFTDWIRQRLVDILGNDELLTGGYQVVTTLDWELQQVAEREVEDGVRAIDKRQGFAGPIDHIEDEEKISELFTEARKKVYHSVSRYFFFDAEGSIREDVGTRENELEDYRNHLARQVDVKTARMKRDFIFGNNEIDHFNDYVRAGDEYKGIVRRVNDRQRLVYVDFAGLRGVIPYQYFRWAHEREISEDRHYFAYVKRPSSILKEGDIIYVKIIHMPSKILKYFDKSYSLALSNDEKKIWKRENYYILSLEQIPVAEGALVSISPQSGELLSLVGGASFQRSQFNRVIQSNRQPGSAFKPFIYAAGLENGFTAASMLYDTPQALGGGGNLNWKPRNYDGTFKGMMSFRRALETSRNIPTIKLTQDIGVKKMREFADRLGFKAILPPDLSISLGSFGVSLLDLVRAYAIFPSGGKKVKVKSILSVKDRFGNEVDFREPSEKEQADQIAKEEESTEEKKVDEVDNADVDENVAKMDEEIINPFHVHLTDTQVYDSRLAYIMNNLLKGVVANGTGRRAKHISPFIGGKTGTTNNYVDAWFLGFSKEVVTGVWTGFDNNQTLGWGETGAKSALPIWKVYMEASIKKFGKHDFDIPEGIINVLINPENGKLVSDSEQDSIMEAFVEGTAPQEQGFVDTNLQEGKIPSPVMTDDQEYYLNQ